MIALARARPVRGTQWKRYLGLHVGTALGLTGLGVTLQKGLLRALRPDYATRVPLGDGIPAVLQQRGVLFLMLYGGIVGFSHALDVAPVDSSTAGSNDRASEEQKGQETTDRISVRTGDAIVPVTIGNIEWIEAADSYVRLHALSVRGEAAGLAVAGDPAGSSDAARSASSGSRDRSHSGAYTSARRLMSVPSRRGRCLARLD